MNLLYLHNADVASEVANLVQVISMCNAFAENNINVTLVLNSHNKNITQKDVHKIIESQFGIRPIFRIILNTSLCAKYNRLGKYFNGFYYRNIIKKFNPDVCFIRHHLLIKSCIQGKKPFIFEIHNASFYNHPQFINNLCIKKVITASKSSYLLKIVVISENLKKLWVNRGIESSKIISLHDGFNSHLFEKGITQQKARELLSLPQGKKIAIYTGSLYPDREIDNIIQLASRIPEALFIVVGGPQNNVDFFSNVARDKGLKNITFVGRKNHNEIPLYLFAADVLLALWSRKVPTINYCSPLKVFEYMAAGRIVVAHAFPTITEVLKDNENALLVDPDSFDDLLQKVNEALMLIYPNKLSQNARELAFNQYTWNKRVGKIIKTLKEHN